MSRDGPTSTTGIPGSGELFGNTYRMDRILGRGAMGVVVAAEHITLRRQVAVKFLLPGVMRHPWATARFLREARAAAKIRSEHVAHVIDVGVSDAGIPFIVMQRLTGTDMQALLDARGPLPIAEAVGYVLQACEAIAKAHALGIVHRDLKPGNLFMTPNPDGGTLVKVLDFGLSKAIGGDALSHDGKITSATTVLGSPCYMSPEQIRSAKDVDQRTDLWSLGVILYQLLTERFPFDAPNVPALFAVIAADPPVRPSVYRPDLPAELEATILRCLHKDVSQRVQTIAELSRVLAPFATGRSRRLGARLARMGRKHYAQPGSRRLARRRYADVDSQAPTVPGTLVRRGSVRPPALVRGSVRPPPSPAVTRPLPDDGPTLVSDLAGLGPAPRPAAAAVVVSSPAPALSKRPRSAPITSSVVQRRRGTAVLIALAVALIAASALAATLWPRHSSSVTHLHHGATESR